MPTKRTTVTDGAYPSDRMRELGRRGAAAVERDPVTKRFRKRSDAAAAGPAPEAPEPPPPPADPTPPEPRIEEAPGLLGRFLGRRR